MTKRILTLLVELEEYNKPDWIWNCHLDKEFHHGIRVIAIGEGDQMSDPEDEE